MKSRKYCLTLNNPQGKTQHTCAAGLCLGFEPTEMNYMIVGREVGNKEQTPHLQAFVIFKNRKLFKSVKKRFPHCHIEAARGSVQENIDYCSKEGQTCIHGDVPDDVGQGTRSDLKSLHETIRNGSSLRTIADKHFNEYLKYGRNIERLRLIYSARREWPVCVEIYTGPPGSGKTRKAFEDHPGAYFKDNSKWWDGYDGHETVIWDEFNGSVPYNELLRITDRYPYQAQTKGGYVSFLARRIIFTSNTEPEEWYPNVSEKPELWGAFERRITNHVKFRKINQSP